MEMAGELIFSCRLWRSKLMFLVEISGQRMNIVIVSLDGLFVRPGRMKETQRTVCIIEGLFVLDEGHWIPSDRHGSHSLGWHFVNIDARKEQSLAGILGSKGKSVVLYA
jgi:hypothetical protein